MTYLPSLNQTNGDGRYIAVDHIDLWVRMLSDDVAAVATLDPESLKAFKESPAEFLAPIFSVPPSPKASKRVLEDFRDLQSKLDAGAEILSKKARKKVVRIPHPVPISGILEPFLNAVQSGNRLLLSDQPANNFNIGGLRPALLAAIKKRVIEVLKTGGFEAKFFDASPLLGGSGALHCATASLPAALFANVR